MYLSPFHFCSFEHSERHLLIVKVVVAAGVGVGVVIFRKYIGRLNNAFCFLHGCLLPFYLPENPWWQNRRMFWIKSLPCFASYLGFKIAVCSKVREMAQGSMIWPLSFDILPSPFFFSLPFLSYRMFSLSLSHLGPFPSTNRLHLVLIPSSTAADSTPFGLPLLPFSSIFSCRQTS